MSTMLTGAGLIPAARSNTDVVVAVPSPRSCSRRSLGTVFLVALAATVFLYHRLLIDVRGAYLVHADGDQNGLEWVFTAAAHNMIGLHNPFHSSLEYAPLGVNLLANVAMLGLAIPLAPVTLLFGPEVTFALIVTLGPALACAAWFWLFRRWLVEHAAAALTGAAFCSFAPALISHGNGHLNFTFAAVIPLILDRLLLLTRGGRVRRDGVVLGLLCAYQVFVGEELLLLAAIGATLFGLSYAACRPGVARQCARPVIRGLGVGAAVALPLTAGALYWQFFGPMSYREAVSEVPPATPAAIFGLPSQSLGGRHGSASDLVGWTEQNAFFGLWLPCVALVFVVVFRRLVEVRAAAAMTVVAAVFSMGDRIVLPNHHVLIGPWRLASGLPVLGSVVVSRLSMICVVGLAIVLAVAVEHFLGTDVRGVRLVGLATVGLALAPLTPTPYAVSARQPVPTFISSGIWRSYVQPGHTLVFAPLPWFLRSEPLHWATRADLGFALAGGYFRGPDSSGRGVPSGIPRPTGQLFASVQYSGQPVVADAATRAAARADLAFWRADALVIDPSAAQDALRVTIESLLGRPADRAGGVFVWRITARDRGEPGA